MVRFSTPGSGSVTSSSVDVKAQIDGFQRHVGNAGRLSQIEAVGAPSGSVVTGSSPVGVPASMRQYSSERVSLAHIDETTNK